METTPNDLRQQQFEIKFRGYNPDDVEVFRDLAASALEETRAEALKLSEENAHLKERLAHLTSIEETLKAAVLEAQKNAESTIGNAKQQAETTISQANREAELIVRKAELERDEVIADMRGQMTKLVGDINKIRYIRSNYLNKLKAMISSQLDTISEAIAEDSDADAPKPEMPPEKYDAPASHEEPEEVPPPPENVEMEFSEDEVNQAVEALDPDSEGKSPQRENNDDEWRQLKEQLKDE